MSRYGSAALDAELDRLDLTSKGHRHRQLFASACALGELVAGGELSVDRAAGALTEAGLRLGLGVADVRRTVERGLERGRTQPRRSPDTGVTNRAEVLAEVCRWWESIERCPPTGRSAGTTLRVLAAFRALALEAGKLQLRQPYREIAEVAGIASPTVQRRRKDWAPWVRCLSSGSSDRRVGARSEWRLVVRPERANDTSPVTTPVRERGLVHFARSPGESLSDPGHNTWHGWANGWRLWCALDTFDATTTRALADALGLHPSTVRRHGNRLEAMGLATSTEDGWRAVAVSFDQAARFHLDGTDHALERRERHDRERQLHHRFLLDRIEGGEAVATFPARAAQRNRARRTADRGRRSA